MIAYKGFHGNLTCSLGKGVFQYAPGQTIRERRSECAGAGLHCTEYALECFKWYAINGKNRYFEVEASGSIDECGTDAKIACTELTLLKELTVFQVANRGMAYMVEHPFRDWRLHAGGCVAARDRAEAFTTGHVAIARGARPMAKGPLGAILGLLLEERPGRFLNARIFRVEGDIKPDVWYTLEERGIQEVAA